MSDETSRGRGSRSEVTIREAQARDDAAIGELLINSFVETYARKMAEVVVTEHRKADLRDVASKRAVACVLAAEVAGELAGTVTVFPPGAPTSRAWDPECADLRYLAVDPRFHGRGIADVLMKAAHERVAEYGARGISLHIRRGVQGLARFYSRHGYVRAPEGDRDLLPEIFLEAYRRPA